MSEENICKGCGATERDFKFWMPLSITESVDKAGTKQMRVAGIASDENSPDLQGERVFVDGLETDYLLERGAFNWNHGKEPGDILGEIDTVNKASGKLHVGGFLYPHVKQAVDTYNLMRSMKDSGSNRKLGLSIEGKIKERSGKDVRKAWLKAVAMTYNPINQGSWVDVIKSMDGVPFNKCVNCKLVDGAANCSGCQFAKADLTTEKVLAFLEKMPNPKDAKIHELAGELGMKPDELETLIYGILGDVISHGQGVTPDSKELEAGIKVEMEHTDSPALSKWIAMAHLKELPDYYARLARMEKEGEKALGKAQSVMIDPRTDLLPSEPAPRLDGDEPAQGVAIKICPKCSKPIPEGGSCPCDPRAGHDEVSDNLDETTPNSEEAAYVRADNKADLEKQLSTMSSGMAAGYDIPAASGGVGGSALREEDLDKKKKVTTFDERHLGIKKIDPKKFSKSDLVIMIKAQGYEDEVAEHLADLIMKAAIAGKHPEKVMVRGKTKTFQAIRYKGKAPKAEAPKEEYGRYGREHAPELGAPTPGGLRRPTDAEWNHEKFRITHMNERALSNRVWKIGQAQKMYNFALALEDENYHDLARMAYDKLLGMGYDVGGRKLGKEPIAVRKLKNIVESGKQPVMEVPEKQRRVISELPVKPPILDRPDASKIVTPSKVTTANPGHGYHGEFVYELGNDGAHNKYRETHALVKQITGGGDLVVKKYLDSVHGRHLAGHEDEAYIKKDYKRFVDGLFSEEQAKINQYRLKKEKERKATEKRLMERYGTDAEKRKFGLRLQMEALTNAKKKIKSGEFTSEDRDKLLEALTSTKPASGERMGRLIEPEVEKAWPESKTEGSLGHTLNQLVSAGQSRVRSHPRFGKNAIQIVPEHHRINKQGKDGYNRLKSLLKKKRGRKSAMDIAADAAGLTKVRGAVSGKTYYE